MHKKGDKILPGSMELRHTHTHTHTHTHMRAHTHTHAHIQYVSLIFSSPLMAISPMNGADNCDLNLTALSVFIVVRGGGGNISAVFSFSDPQDEKNKG